jgi:hypothetical protein
MYGVGLICHPNGNQPDSIGTAGLAACPKKNQMSEDDLLMM